MTIQIAKREKLYHGVQTLSDEVEFEQFLTQKKLYEKKKRKQEINKAKKAKIEKKAQSLKIPPSIEFIIDYWNSKPLRKVRKNTKRFIETVLVLKKVRMGRYFQPYMFTDEELKSKYIGKKIRQKAFTKAIDRFALLADDHLYIRNENQMKWYKKLTLRKFIYFESFKGDKKTSLLIECLENEPLPNSVPTLKMPDRYPELSLRLKNLYVKNVLGGASVTLKERDMNCFRIGANKLHDFYIKNKNKMPYMIGGEIELADMLYKALEKSNHNKIKIYPGKFCSDHTFSHVLPVYLDDENMIQNGVTY